MGLYCPAEPCEGQHPRMTTRLLMVSESKHPFREIAIFLLLLKVWPHRTKELILELGGREGLFLSCYVVIFYAGQTPSLRDGPVLGFTTFRIKTLNSHKNMPDIERGKLDTCAERERELKVCINSFLFMVLTTDLGLQLARTPYRIL